MQTSRGTCVDFSKVDLNLQNYITKSKKRLQAILKRLQWSEELVLKHCSDKSNAAATLSDDEAEPSLPASFSTNNSLVITEDALRAIVADPKAEIPQRFSDLQCNFNRQQKLQIYEHVVQNTEKLLEPELTVPINDESMTFAEIVAIKKREKKQKRRKYRTSKPTHIEEVRNLVELQMQALEQYLHPEKATAPRLSNRERDFKQRQYRGRSTSKGKERISATNEDGRKERRHISAYRRRNASRQRSTSVNKSQQKPEKEHLKHGSESRYKDHRRRSRSHGHSASREKERRNSLKQRTYRSDSRDRRHRSRSKERRHRSRSRSKEGRRYKKHRSRSKDKIHRSRSKERRHKSRSWSRSKNKKRSRDRSDNTRSKSRSYEKKRQKEHNHKRSDYEAKSRNYEKDRHKDSRYIEKSKQENRRTNGISKKYDNSLTEVQHKTKEKTQTQNRRDRDTCSDSYKRDETYTSSIQNINETLDPIIKRQSNNEELMDKKNNGLTSHYIKLEIKTDPDNKAQVLEDIKMKEEPH